MRKAKDNNNHLVNYTWLFCNIPVGHTEIEGVNCHALVDTGALLSIIIAKKKNNQIKTKKIKTLRSTNTRKIKIYFVKIQDISCKFGFEAELNHLEKKRY